MVGKAVGEHDVVSVHTGNPTRTTFLDEFVGTERNTETSIVIKDFNAGVLFLVLAKDG